MGPEWPESWEKLVEEAHRRLAKSERPFQDLTLPLPKWETSLVQASRCLENSRKDSILVLLPSLATADDVQAKEAWQKKVDAAIRLKSLGYRGPWANIIDCGTLDRPGYIILEWPNFASKSVADRHPPSLRAVLELGISCCRILERLNQVGISVLDLNSSSIGFDWQPESRFTVFLDPTAVVPAVGILPEHRHAYIEGPFDSSETAKMQVWLVGAFLLAVLADSVDRLSESNIPIGKNASLSHLGLADHLSDSSVEIITSHVEVELGKKFGGPLGVRPLLDNVLVPSLSENPEQRFHSVDALRKALENVSKLVS